MAGGPQRVLAEESWKAAYIFTCFLSDRECETESQNPTPDNARLEITHYGPHGQWAGRSTRDSLIDTASPEIRGWVEEFLHETKPFYGYVVHRLWAKLTPSFASGLAADRRACDEAGRSISYNMNVNDVMRGLCPLAAEGGALAPRRTVQHVLYFEPKNDLAPGAPHGISCVEAAAAVCDYFDAVGNRATPVVLEDVILLPAIGFGNPSFSCVAVRLRPFREEEGLQIPLVPVQILNLAGACELKRALARDLSALPISSEGYWEMFQTMTSFRSYSQEYMSQRLPTEKLVQRASEASRAMEQQFPTWLLRKGAYEEFAAFPQVRSPHAWWSWRTLQGHIQYRTQSADEALDHSLQRVVERTRALDDLLRDAALADVSTTNLRLARSVRYLTWVVLLVSLIGLIVSALPDTRKAAYLDALFGTSRQSLP
jgi:hypothetical protein